MSTSLHPDAVRPVSGWSRGRVAGVLLGALPQALLMAFLVLQLVVSDGREARLFLVLLVIPEVSIVPVSVLVALVCQWWPATRQFGRGALAGTLVSAALFIPICLVTSADV